MDQLRYHLEIARRLFITFRFECGFFLTVDYFAGGSGGFYRLFFASPLV